MVTDEISLDASDSPGRGDGMLRTLLAPYWFPFLLTIVLMLACYSASLQRESTTRNGQVIAQRSTPTLGLFLGGLVVATVVTPGVVLAEESWFGRVVAWAGVVDAILLVWLAPILSGVVTFGDWLEAIAVVVAYAAAIGSAAWALRWARMPAVLAAAVTVVLGLADGSEPGDGGRVAGVGASRVCAERRDARGLSGAVGADDDRVSTDESRG
jgi:hypothetical protein